ncbi:hypothetical protein H0H92_004654 [Tricholoma furcatifolium]|nr:hypothetical protein H0H92_004654 [Tricholoma furcatifolium]
MASLPASYGNFDLVKRVKLDFTDVVVSKWRTPIVNGYFVVPTEIFNDSGCPHTLEHLVFMGSENYPFKGVLDNLANRGFSNGTNAWTDTDHTAYTISTAGEQGFLQLLPIYVDHILYPTITKAGFVTEVHHIDAKGQDSGVVYSEMQGRENTSADLMALHSQRLVNSPESAYRSETGGLMEALRVLTPEQSMAILSLICESLQVALLPVREYHRTYYVPHNLSLIVAGKLSSGTLSLLDVVQKQIETSIVAHGQDKGPRPPGWKRPFVETPSVVRAPILETVTKTVEFPEKDESMGELLFSFLGPAPDAFLERKAVEILGTYMTSSSVAPLNKEYIEIEHPLCGYIYFGEDTRATQVDLPIYIGSVPTEHLDTFYDKLRGSLQRIVKEGIDMGRMSMVLNREERQSGERLTHEEVVNKLDDETVSYEVGLGLSNSFTDTFRISIKVETARYGIAVAWLRDLIYGAEFDKDRLQIAIAKFQQSLPELKRSGDNVLGSLWAELVFNDDSTSRAGSILPQLEFVPALAKQLQANPDEVIADFEDIRKELTNPSGARFSVTGNVLGLEHPRSTWAKHFSESQPATELPPVPFSSDTLSEVGKNPVKKAIVMSLPTIESSYVTHATKGIQGFTHPDYAVIRVTAEVLNATESYLWRYIRGSGLAYGAYVSSDVEAGLLTFSLYRSSNSLGAFHEAAKVVKGLVDRSIKLDQTTIDAAKSSIVYGVTKNVSTAGRAAIVSFTNQALKGVSKTHQVDLLEKYQAVTKDDILAALEKHFLPLFLPSSSVAVTVTAPSKAEQVSQGLKEAGFVVEQRALEVDPNEVEQEDSESEEGSESEGSESDSESR